MRWERQIDTSRYNCQMCSCLGWDGCIMWTGGTDVQIFCYTEDRTLNKYATKVWALGNTLCCWALVLALCLYLFSWKCLYEIQLRRRVINLTMEADASKFIPSEASISLWLFPVMLRWLSLTISIAWEMEGSWGLFCSWPLDFCPEAKEIIPLSNICWLLRM